MLLETRLAFEASLSGRCKFCKSKMYHTWLQFLSQDFTREVLSHAATQLFSKQGDTEAESTTENFSSKIETAFNMLNRPSEGFVREEEAATTGNESTQTLLKGLLESFLLKDFPTSWPNCNLLTG
eukprot:gb/GECG01008682.1/.p1 GENE.gb/GECG01008682.1/~~gb/GECG01008682.1/.p1  ORF type:complete len:125 (+),score=18.66 gb/GECG01008682.1/:1-375(+)